MMVGDSCFAADLAGVLTAWNIWLGKTDKGEYNLIKKNVVSTHLPLAQEDLLQSHLLQSLTEGQLLVVDRQIGHSISHSSPAAQHIIQCTRTIHTQ